MESGGYSPTIIVEDTADHGRETHTYTKVSLTHAKGPTHIRESAYADSPMSTDKASITARPGKL